MTSKEKHIIKSEIEDVRLLSKHFRNFCNKHQLVDSFTDSLELALVEASNNIIIHSYENLKDNEIIATFVITDKEIVIKLTDYGKEFNESLSKKLSSDISTLPEGNWGLDLIDSIMDQVERKRSNDKNILILKKNLE